jgi:hypothetical protein
MTQPIDIISRALKDIGALEAGETPTPEAAQDAFDMLNDLVDQWSNEDMMVYNTTEIIFPLISGQVQYTIGPNPSTANFVGASFTGSIRGNILTVTGLTTGAVAQGQTLKGTGILPGTKIVQFISGAGGQVNEVGTYQLNIVYPISVSSQLITAYYQKPLFIDQAYVRVNTQSNGQAVPNGGLDYPVAILALENYNQIGLKTLNGPWPKALYYNPNAESGNIFVWPNPSQGEMHMFSSTIFSHYETLNDNISLPQGYAMALRWNLAERLMPMYGKVNVTQIGMINAYAAQSKSTIKRNNMMPIASAGYPDSMLVGRAKDAGWILSGGFFR